MRIAMAMQSPVGTLWLHAEDDRLVGLDLPERSASSATPGATTPAKITATPAAATAASAGRSDVLVRAAAQLAEYFAGERRVFDLPLAPAGTEFQRLVWHALARIPFGVTCSYGDLARVVGRPAASRAVGAANGRNPIAIILPCHRVIGASGALTGYGGGLPMKRWLLDHERACLQPSLPGHAVPRRPAPAELPDGPARSAARQ